MEMFIVYFVPVNNLLSNSSSVLNWLWVYVTGCRHTYIFLILIFLLKLPWMLLSKCQFPFLCGFTFACTLRCNEAGEAYINLTAKSCSDLLHRLLNGNVLYVPPCKNKRHEDNYFDNFFFFFTYYVLRMCIEGGQRSAVNLIVQCTCWLWLYCKIFTNAMSYKTVL